MLYVTTRSNRDAFTANRALTENRGPDGGLYLPFKTPRFSAEQIDALAEMPFNQCVAEILNLLFNTKLSAWDIDFSAGRYPVRLESLRNRIHIAQLWHNPDLCFERMVNNLAYHICGEIEAPTDWLRIAVRTAVLFGIFGELKRSGIGRADVCMVSGDFTAPISAWYARQWGLPVGNIICCCNENNSLWDLFCHGQLRTDAVSAATALPDADVCIPADLERLVYECGGVPETLRYLEACRQGRIYSPSDAFMSRFRQGLFVSVVSTGRAMATIPGVYRTHGNLMSPYTALAYAGLLDYRAKTGEAGHAVVLAENSPERDVKAVSAALDIPEEQIRTLL